MPTTMNRNTYRMVTGLLLCAALLACDEPKTNAPEKETGWVNLAEAMLMRKVQCIEMHPATATTIYVGLFDGLLKTTDGGKQWYPAEDGLLNRDIKSIAICIDNPQRLYCGSWGRGLSRSEDGGGSWASLGGEVVNTLVNGVHMVGQKDDVIWLATATGIYRKSKAEVNWSSMFKNSRLILSVTSMPRHPTTLLLGMLYTGFARTTDDGARWFYMNEGVQGSGGYFDAPRQFAFGGSDSSRLYAASESGYFYLSLNEGVSWQRKFENIAWKNAVAIRTDSRRPDRLYACTSTRIHRSDDAGLSWTNITDNLPAVTITSFQIASGNHNTLYLGTKEHGLFKCVESK